MHDYKNIDKYLDSLQDDIYGQPVDEGHTDLALAVYEKWFRGNPWNLTNILDVGCGDNAFMKPLFVGDGVGYTGIALGTENENVVNMDFNFLEFPDYSFDCIFSRHSLEHSPMPLLTLMEWHRVAKSYLCLVVPNPEYHGYVGKNHYSVMPKSQLKWLLRRAGWKVLEKEYTPSEFRFLCLKLPVIGYEGYAPIPLPHDIYIEDINET
jgi:SAM-dependent methyltransferase